MFLPCFLFFAIFSYAPMLGMVLAFKEFKFNMSLWDYPWVGLKYFRDFFSNYQAGTIIKNTFIIGIIKVVVEFPFPIMFALMINEVRDKRAKSVIQTISYLPYFLSWVVVAAVVQRVLAPNTGILNQAISALGGDGSYFFMMKPESFYPVVLLSDLWKNIGWNSIIYLAAIAGIDPGLYEAARVDGANKRQELFHVTLPSIRMTIGIMFILGLGGLVSSGFEQVYLLRTPGNMELADTLDVYVIQVGLSQGQYGYAAAVGLLQGIVGFILVYVGNQASKKFTEVSVW
jgi:putative aldouronate transport system permease protein